MWEKIKLAVLLVGLGLLSLHTATRVLAAPLPPINVVNHATKECAEIWQGDECQTCVPAAGWEILNESCPAGYTVLDRWAPTDCSLYASAYCCGTVNSEWSGCIGYPGYRPPISFWAVVVCIAIAITGISLYIWAKKENERKKL